MCPGYVRTPLVENQIADQAAQHGIDEAQVLDEVLLARTPIKRLVEPDEVAAAVAYLCGPRQRLDLGDLRRHRRGLDRRLTRTDPRSAPPNR